VPSVTIAVEIPNTNGRSGHLGARCNGYSKVQPEADQVPAALRVGPAASAVDLLDVEVAARPR
jgi:hypothetical protein